MTDVFESAFTTPMSRRLLIKRVAAVGAATWAAGALPTLARAAGGGDFSKFNAIAPSSADALQVPDGYAVDVVIKWGDEFAPGMKFGYNCDYSTYFPMNGSGDEGLIWVNHEYIVPFFTSDWPNTPAQNALWNPRVEPYRTIMAREKSEVGGSIIHIRRSKKGPWEVVHGSQYSRRFTAEEPLIGYDGPVASAPSLLPSGGKVAGTLANCSGAQTPWGTILTCEENYQSYGLKRGFPLVFSNGWIRDDGSTAEEVNYYIGEPGKNVDDQDVTDQLPFYGYVVEIDPWTGEAIKHTGLGRIHHENVGIRIGPGGHVVCYTGDDAPALDGMFFKFVSSKPYRPGMSRSDAMKLLAEGQLYVARWLPSSNPISNETDSGTGEWIALDMNDPESCAFTTKWVETNIAEANGYPLTQFRVPRAEDCEVVQNDERRVLISLTSARGRPAPQHLASYGVVRLLEEDSVDPHAQTFRWVDLLEGGPQSGFSSPDNMAFLTPNELLVVTDISTTSIGTPNFAFHGNNAVFYVPLKGENANVAFRFANAPVEAELTGPTYVHQQRTLFLNVQHPGEETQRAGGVVGSPATYTSWWPDGNKTAGTGTPGKPKPSLVAVRKL
jgi:secreted PhoX family phosphatase